MKSVISNHLRKRVLTGTLTVVSSSGFYKKWLRLQHNDDSQWKIPGTRDFGETSSGVDDRVTSPQTLLPTFTNLFPALYLICGIIVANRNVCRKLASKVSRGSYTVASCVSFRFLLSRMTYVKTLRLLEISAYAGMLNLLKRY